MAGNKRSVVRAEPDRRSGHIIRVADVAQKPLFDQILLALGAGFGEVFHQRRATARPGQITLTRTPVVAHSRTAHLLSKEDHLSKALCLKSCLYGPYSSHPLLAP